MPSCKTRSLWIVPSVATAAPSGLSDDALVGVATLDDDANGCRVGSGVVDRHGCLAAAVQSHGLSSGKRRGCEAFHKRVLARVVSGFDVDGRER